MFFFLVSVVAAGSGLALLLAVIGVAAYDPFGWLIGILAACGVWRLAGKWDRAEREVLAQRQSEELRRIEELSPAERAELDEFRQSMYDRWDRQRESRRPPIDYDDNDPF